jgi:hypothetical protein
MGTKQIDSPRTLIGVITHPNSSIDPDSYQKSVKFFEDGLKIKNWQVDFIISDENSFSSKVSLIRIWISKWWNLFLVQKWIHFIENNYEKAHKRFSFRSIADALKRSRVLVLFIINTILQPELKRTEILKYKRNVNISLSHLNVINSAKNSHADLVLVLEDDAILSADEDSLNDLLDFSKWSLMSSNIPSLINLSESLPLEKLFVTNTDGILPQIKVSNNIYMPRIMHHNTTCAVLYNSKYIDSVTSEWHRRIQKFIFRGIPVDWIINALILELPNNSLLTFHSEKNLIIQGSLHTKKN